MELELVLDCTMVLNTMVRHGMLVLNTMVVALGMALQRQMVGIQSTNFDRS